jgi:hypothetical protein
MEESVVQTNVDDNHQNEKQEQQDSKNKSATQQAQLPEPDITSSAKGKIFYCLELCPLIHLIYIVSQ